MISKEEIQHLAQLARLKLSQEEVAELQKDMPAILDYVGQVSTVEGGDKETLYSPQKNVMRDDVPRAAADPLAEKREKLLEALPRREEDYAVVRKIIDK